MKILVLGDTHGRTIWKLILNMETSFDKVIFIGDYFDTHEATITADKQISNFLDIVQYKQDNFDKVILLIGNHDHHYFKEVGYTGTSGYQSGAAAHIGQILEENRGFLQMAYKHDNYLFTHAGVGEEFMDKWMPEVWNPDNVADLINDLWKYKSWVFKFDGWDPTGDNTSQTPIWIRPRSLMRGSTKLKDAGIIQIVGHTQVNQIDIKGKATGSKFFFIDALGTSGEYLIIDNGEFKCGNTNQFYIK